MVLTKKYHPFHSKIDSWALSHYTIILCGCAHVKMGLGWTSHQYWNLFVLIFRTNKYRRYISCIETVYRWYVSYQILVTLHIPNRDYSVIVNLAMNRYPAKHLLSGQIVAYSISVSESGQRHLLSVSFFWPAKFTICMWPAKC